NAANACVKSMGGIGSCNAGFRDCDGNAGNGCEIDVNSDKSNCGAYGNVCPMGQSCIAGVCKLFIKVLLAHGEVTQSYYQDVQTKLMATGAFGAVDLFNARNATPTVQQLQAYDSVLV